MGNCRWALLSLGGHVGLFGCVIEPYGLVTDADVEGSLEVKEETGVGLV